MKKDFKTARKFQGLRRFHKIKMVLYLLTNLYISEHNSQTSQNLQLPKQVYR